MANNNFITVTDLNRINQLEEKLQVETNNRLNALEIKISNLRILESYLEQKCIDLARHEDHLSERLRQLETLAREIQKPEHIWSPESFLTDLYCDEEPDFAQAWQETYPDTQPFDITEIEELLK